MPAAKYVICADAEQHLGVISVQCTARVSTSWNPFFLSSTLIWNNEDKYTIRHFHICIAHTHTHARFGWRHWARADGSNEMSSSRNICVSWLISLLNGNESVANCQALPQKFNAYHIRTDISANNETETNRKKKKNSKYVFSSGLWCDVRQLTTSLLTFGSGKPIFPICHRFSIEWARARISHTHSLLLSVSKKICSTKFSHSRREWRDGRWEEYCISQLIYINTF